MRQSYCSEGIWDWIFLNLVSFTLRPPAALEKELGTPDYEAGGRCGRFGEKKISFPCRYSNPIFGGH